MQARSDYWGVFERLYTPFARLARTARKVKMEGQSLESKLGGMMASSPSSQAWNSLKTLWVYSHYLRYEQCRFNSDIGKLETVVDELAEKPISTSHGQAVSFASLYKREFAQVRMELWSLKVREEGVEGNSYDLHHVESLVHELRFMAEIYDYSDWVGVCPASTEGCIY
jgi:hypothetical protein